VIADRIEGKWIDAFREVLALCGVQPGDAVAILSETQSRALNVHLAELALHALGARAFHLVVPTPRSPHPVPVRSTGASEALGGLEPVLAALCAAPLVVDLTLEGLMHARETGRILGAGARILHVSNEHPEALERLRPDPALEGVVRAAARRLRGAARMRVTSPAGTALTVELRGASTVGVWGWTAKPGTLAHWPGGLVVAFPAADTVEGTLVLAPGDLNLTFKRYVEQAVTLRIERDHVVAVEGAGVDAMLFREYLDAWGDAAARAVSHVGWGLNRRARHEAMALYGRRDTNGTELRAVAGNFLFSTGANEFAGRLTAGHFDLPIMGTTIALDDAVVVRDGVPVD
jgi:2,5-dihydroxypyridine 5,6-dioxygenase